MERVKTVYVLMRVLTVFCVLWVKAHSARGGRGVNRKHHPAERGDLRFGFQSARKNLKSHAG